MKKLKRIAVTAIAVAILGAGAGSIAAAQDAPQGNAADGKRVYLADGCFTCHGRSGQGGAYNGPAPILAHTALPFDGTRRQCTLLSIGQSGVISS
jgi:mono/diheme cytochrome c family protein